MRKSELLKKKKIIIAEEYGTIAQVNKLIEELDELKVECENFLYGKKPGYALYSEIADVLNVCESVSYALDCEDAVLNIRIAKLDRQMKRINESKENDT